MVGIRRRRSVNRRSARSGGGRETHLSRQVSSLSAHRSSQPTRVRRPDDAQTCGASYPRRRGRQTRARARIVPRRAHRTDGPVRRVDPSRSRRALASPGAGPPRLRLFCLPQAGAGAWCFHNGWSARLPPDVEVLPVELPGRNSRASEPADAHPTLQRLASAVLDGVRHLLPGGELPGQRPPNPPHYALFGHSLGAWLAYEIACEVFRRRRERGDVIPMPTKLYLSGNRRRVARRPGPRPRPRKPDHRQPPRIAILVRFRAKVRRQPGASLAGDARADHPGPPRGFPPRGDVPPDEPRSSLVSSSGRRRGRPRRQSNHRRGFSRVGSTPGAVA